MTISIKQFSPDFIASLTTVSLKLNNAIFQSHVIYAHMHMCKALNEWDIPMCRMVTSSGTSRWDSQNQYSLENGTIPNIIRYNGISGKQNNKKVKVTKAAATPQ